MASTVAVRRAPKQADLTEPVVGTKAVDLGIGRPDDKRAALDDEEVIGVALSPPR
jgi:hypothetical protein